MKLPPLNALAEVSSKARRINFVLSLLLHPTFAYASSEVSGKAAHMRKASLLYLLIDTKV